MRPRISIRGSVRWSVRNAFVSNTRKRVILALEVDGMFKGREKERGEVRGEGEGLI